MKTAKEAVVHKADSIVALDIGNTNIDIGLIDLKRLKCSRRTTVSSRATEQTFRSAINKVRGSQSARIVMSSVRKDVIKVLKPLLAVGMGMSVRTFKYKSDMGIKLCYKKPSMLGTDRLANLLYAAKRFPGQDSVLISAGTAITIDYLRKGSSFVGGYILPGPSLQLFSLATGTSRLPTINRAQQVRTAPGTTTRECISAGVHAGVAGAVTSIVSVLRQKYSEEARIVVTGGAWQSAVASKSFPYEHHPDATLTGIALGA